MKTIGSMVLAAALAMTGCSQSDAPPSGSPGTPDFAALQTKLTTPTGTFSAVQGVAIRDGLSKQLSAARVNVLPSPGMTSASGATSQRTLSQLSPADVHVLDLPSCDAPTPSGPSQCACAAGGTITLDTPPIEVFYNPHIDFTSSGRADACASSTGRIVDGSAYAHITAWPLVEVLSIHVKVSGNESASYDVDYLSKDGVTTYAIDVADGHVLVSVKGSWDESTQTGTLVIVDKNDTWTCNVVKGKGGCKSTKGGVQTMGA